MSGIMAARGLLLSGAWNPNVANGLRGWWISDNPANTLSSGFLSGIADKSGNANSAFVLSGTVGNQATLVSSGLNGRTIWRSDSSSKRGLFLLSDLTVAQNAPGITLAVVSRLNPTIGTTDASVLRFNVNGATSARAMLGRDNGTTAFAGAAYVGGRRLDADSFAGAQDAADHSNNWIVHVGVLNYATANALLSVNGTTTINSSFLTTGSTSNTTSLSAAIGHGGAGGSPAYGDYAECMVYRAALGTNDRQKLEGYLAWQWGLQANLAVGHPYLSAPP